MKKIIILPLAALLTLPLAARAHETQVFEINGRTYQFVVGSLNEPVTVDDKTGVELRVTDPAGTAITGLEESLKVELVAGEKKKTLDLSPVFNTPGAYKAPFYPTVATTFSYRFSGTLNNAPIDLTFACSPGGHAIAEEDTARTAISDGVVRVKKIGTFGCPAPKAEMGFPEPSTDILTLQQSNAGGTDMLSWAALVLALAALAAAFLRRRS
jgi:hypothetical protein